MQPDSLAQSAMCQIRSAVDRFMHEKYVSQFKPQFHDGFRLLFFRPEDVAIVIEGLEVLKHLYPRGYKRAARFVPTIVETAPLPTHYEAVGDACYLNLTYSRTPAEVAGSLVHEATHGYLIKIRHIQYRGVLKEKQERICFSQESKFLGLCFALMDKQEAAKCRAAWNQYVQEAFKTQSWEGGRLRRTWRVIRAWKSS